MNNETNKICAITSNKEEYICINEQCSKQNKKQLFCFECITKQHRKENNNIVNHIDDFKNITAFMNEVNVKKLERIAFINIMLGQLYDFKKEKFQQIEKYPNNPKEFLDQIKNQVETDIQTFIQQLAEQIIILNKISDYNALNHTIIFQIYYQTKRPYFEGLNEKKKILEEKINSFIYKMDLDLHQVVQRYQQKQQQLENQIQQLNKQPSFLNSFIFKSFFVLLLIIVGLNPLILMTDNNERQEMNQKMIEFQNFVQNVQQEIENKMQLLKEEINKSVQYQVINVQEKIEQVEFKLNQTDTPYNQFKNYFNQKFQQYNETFQQIVEKKIQIQEDETQKIIKQVNQQQQKQNTFISQLDQQMLQVKNEIKNQEKQQNIFKQSIQNITQNFTNTSNIIRHYKQQLLLNTMILHDRTVNKEYKQQKIEQLLGQIHVDIPIKEFEGFTIIYNEFYNKPFDRKTIADIKQVIYENTLLCIGGMKVDNSDVVLVAACDYQSEIFQYTYHWQHAKKSKNGELYWYVAFPVAFGFSPTEQIHLTLCDDLDPTDKRRLSYWFENGADGGRRIGNQTQLINSIDYKMIMFAI